MFRIADKGKTHKFELTEAQQVSLNEGQVAYIENGELLFIHTQKTIKLLIEKINQEFDEKIDDFLSKYPKREQDTFAQKRIEAERIIAGGESIYISGKAEALGITKNEFSEIIIAKSNEFTTLYTKLENEKDLKILELEIK